MRKIILTFAFISLFSELVFSQINDYGWAQGFSWEREKVMTLERFHSIIYDGSARGKDVADGVMEVQLKNWLVTSADNKYIVSYNKSFLFYENICLKLILYPKENKDYEDMKSMFNESLEEGWQYEYSLRIIEHQNEETGLNYFTIEY